MHRGELVTTALSTSLAFVCMDVSYEVMTAQQKASNTQIA